MPLDTPHLEAVLAAAERLLGAREDQMVTSESWDDLAQAVAACREPDPHERTETFTVEDGYLVRSVKPARGDPYVHRCPLDTFEAVAHAIGEATEPFNLEDLRAATKAPWSQAAVAFAFLRERSIVVPASRKRHKAAHAGGTHLDAMTEYHALREKGAGGADPE